MQNTDTTNTDQTIVPNIWALAAKLEDAMETNAASTAAVQTKADEKITAVQAQADAQIAKLNEAFKADLDTLVEQVKAHPKASSVTAFLQDKGLIPGGAPKASASGVAKAGDKTPKFVLVKKADGAIVTDAKGKDVTFTRTVNTVGFSLKTQIGDDLSVYAVKDIATGAVLDTVLEWRKPKSATA